MYQRPAFVRLASATVSIRWHSPEANSCAIIRRHDLVISRQWRSHPPSATTIHVCQTFGRT